MNELRAAHPVQWLVIEALEAHRVNDQRVEGRRLFGWSSCDEELLRASFRARRPGVLFRRTSKPEPRVGRRSESRLPPLSSYTYSRILSQSEAPQVIKNHRP